MTRIHTRVWPLSVAGAVVLVACAAPTTSALATEQATPPATAELTPAPQPVPAPPTTAQPDPAQPAQPGAATAANPAAPAGSQAIAELARADGTPAGTARIVQSAEGLDVEIGVLGMRAGTYAVHIHTTGRCDAPDFATAGAHWNPSAKQHGRDNPMGAHAGDLPNVTVGADGTGTITARVPGTVSGQNALIDADGAAVVVHAGQDDFRTDPSGNSGVRVSCGVLRTTN